MEAGLGKITIGFNHPLPALPVAEGDKPEEIVTPESGPAPGIIIIYEGMM